MKKALYIVFIAVFFAMCLVPSVGLLMKGPGEAAANEIPAVLPTAKNYDGSWNKSYFTGLRDYVGKGFFLRLQSITAWDTLAADIFHTAEDDGVLLGPDGWLFDAVAADELSGTALLSDRAIWCAARSLYLMQEYAQGQGADFVLAVPGGKYRLYPDHAPAYVTVAEGTNLARLMDAMDAQGVTYADLTAAFLAQEEELYWHGDVHWNGKGAALGADTILAALGRESDWFHGSFAEAERHTGDLYAMLFPTGTETEPDYAPTGGFTFEHTSNFHSWDDMTITTECAGADGSLLLFRDSFGRSLYPYLSESFGSAYISRMNSYDLTLIGETGADAVVAEVVESRVDYLLQYPAVYPAPARETSVLDDAVRVESELTADTSGTALADHARLTGVLPETAIDARVYILAGGRVYEAIPNEGSFTAYLSLEADFETAEVYVTK